MVDLSHGVEDVEDSLPRSSSSERRKKMEAKTILIVQDDDSCRSGTKKVLQRHCEHQTYRGKDQQ